MDVDEVDDRTEDEIYIDHLFDTYIDHWGRRLVELYMIYTSLAFISLVPDIYLIFVVALIVRGGTPDPLELRLERPFHRYTRGLLKTYLFFLHLGYISRPPVGRVQVSRFQLEEVLSGSNPLPILEASTTELCGVSNRSTACRSTSATMCTEDVHFYPECRCQCCYRKPCYDVATRPRGHVCHGLIRPLTFTTYSGLCPPCQIVLRFQKRFVSDPANYGDDVYLTELRRERDFFAGTVWVQAPDGRFSEDSVRASRASHEIGEAHPGKRFSAEWNRTVEPQPEIVTSVVKKAWTDGVRWSPDLNLEELRENVRAWYTARNLERERVKRADAELARQEEEDRIAGLAFRSSRDSWRSWVAGDDKAWQRRAPNVRDSGGGSVVTVKVKGPSKWRRWRAWLKQFKRGLVLG